jgi:hypothetical protein
MRHDLSFAHRAAQRLVHRYPRPWRERYEDEVLALFEESPPGFRDVAELTRGLIVERARAALAADDRPGRTLKLLALMRPAVALAAVVMAMTLGYLLRRGQPAPAAVVEIATWAYGAFAVLLYPALLWLGRRQSSSEIGFPLAPAGPPWAVVFLPAFFAIVVALEWGNWGDPTPRNRDWEWVWTILRTYLHGVMAAYLAAAVLPGRRLLRALMLLNGVEEQLKAAEKWVAGCHEMIALGVPSPLAEAQAELQKWQRERDEALARVQQLGYRARFGDGVRS